MPINYQKQTYVNGSGATPLSADRLNHTENGTKAVADAVDQITPLLEDGGRLSETGLSAAIDELIAVGVPPLVAEAVVTALTDPETSSIVTEAVEAKVNEVGVVVASDFPDATDLPPVGITANGVYSWLQFGLDGAPTPGALELMKYAGLTVLRDTDAPGFGIYYGGVRVLSTNARGEVVMAPSQELRGAIAAVPRPVPATLSTANGDKLYTVANNAAKYLLNTFLPTWFGSGSYPYPLTPVFGNVDQNRVRPIAAGASMLAALIRSGRFSETITGVTLTAARDQAVSIIGSIALAHKANAGGWWGGGPAPWTETEAGAMDAQAAMWAAHVGRAAWMLWSNLDAAQRTAVQNMLVAEANRFLDYKLPFWRNRAGADVYGGDSKAEELGWNQRVLAQASIVLPDHANAEKWMTRLIEMSVASSSDSTYLRDFTTLHGTPVADMVNGFNVLDDGLVINHGGIHPGYTMYFCDLLDSASSFAAAGKRVPLALMKGARRSYAALTDLDLGFMNNAYPGPFYKPDGSLNYDGVLSDWGTARRMDAAMVDVGAAVWGADTSSTVKATVWAGLHLDAAIAMQARGTTGQTYQSGDSENLNWRELLVCEFLGHAITYDIGSKNTPLLSDATPGMLNAQNRSLK